MRMALLVALAVAGACDDSLPGPYDQLPLDGDFVVGVGSPVHVVRDRYGVAHIDAATVGDAAFVQGYVMAHDRLPQMDILRRFGAGTLSELFGALDPGVIDTDLEMRMHRMRPLAQQAWDALQASDRTDDREVAQLLQRFADGVNAYAAAIVPDRAPAAYAWNATTAPDLAAPFFVLPGDGSAEWLAEPLSPRYIPHAIDPAAGVLVTANADPVGATFDNDPLNQAKADGSPLYVGITYAAGVRHQRIAEMIAARGGVTLEDMMAVQHDTTSTMGARLTPRLRTLLAYLDAPAGAPADAAAYLAALSPEDRARLIAARDLLAGWTFATPTGLLAGDAQGDAAATSLFNTWMHMFIERTLTDELAAIDFDVWRLDDNALARIVVGVLLAPTELVASADTGEPIVCDALATAGPDDSCSKAALQALLDAMAHLASPAGFGTTDVMTWAWGEKHRLKIQPLFPNTALDLPGPGLPGFPRRGDNFVVNRADAGWDDLDFSQSADGPAQRFIAIADPGAFDAGTPLRVTWALPGGVIYDSRSPHYRDLLDDYYLPEKQFDAPYLTAEIVRDAESRWRFR